jgi:16S rRNA (cytosine967-C5)-methyltransferase
VVNAAVDLTRELGARRAGGFVNAVLRQLQRLQAADGFALPSRPDSARGARALDYLSVTLSHPRWLVARWLERYGFEATERWCLFNNASPEVTVRLLADDPAVARALEAACPEARPAPYAPRAWRLPPGALGRIPDDVRGRLVVQDEGAQVVAHAAGISRGDRVLDVCAAPGGKSLLFHEAAGASGLVVAADRRSSRVALLRQTLAAAGVPGIIVALDAEQPLPVTPTFDRVVLDAPCSGLGTLRRDPDLKWSRHETDLGRLGETAGRMIRHAAAAVRPGGTLLYATCSPEPDENDAIVDRFLSQHPDFAIRAPAALPGVGPGTLTDERGLLRTFPFEHGLDAFFAALLVRAQRT